MALAPDAQLVAYFGKLGSGLRKVHYAKASILNSFPHLFFGAALADIRANGAAFPKLQTRLSAGLELFGGHPWKVHALSLLTSLHPRFARSADKSFSLASSAKAWMSCATPATTPSSNRSICPSGRRHNSESRTPRDCRLGIAGRTAPLKSSTLQGDLQRINCCLLPLKKQQPADSLRCNYARAGHGRCGRQHPRHGAR